MILARTVGPIGGRFIDQETGRVRPGLGRAELLAFDGDELVETGDVVPVRNLAESMIDPGRFVELDAQAPGSFQDWNAGHTIRNVYSARSRLMGTVARDSIRMLDFNDPAVCRRFKAANAAGLDQEWADARRLLMRLKHERVIEFIKKLAADIEPLELLRSLDRMEAMLLIKFGVTGLGHASQLNLEALDEPE